MPQDLSGTARKLLLVIEYDGSSYHGFQLQGDKPTVQRELERALSRLCGEKPGVMAASRTDSGVHALGQVATFITRSQVGLAGIIGGLNYYLPRDISIKDAHEVALSFDARRQAISRQYRYYIYNGTERSPLRSGLSHFVRGPLNASLMNEACRMFVGEHDFASFATQIAGTGPVATRRHVYEAGVIRQGDMVVFQITGSGFLRHQVRNMAGSLVRVGQGKMTLSELYSIIQAAIPAKAGPTLPARGLVLVTVNFASLTLESRHEGLLYPCYQA